MSEQTKEPTDLAPTQELPPPSSDINTDFMQTETCANAFKWMIFAFITFITVPVMIKGYFLVSLPDVLGWCFIGLLLNRITKLSSEVYLIRNTAYCLTALSLVVSIEWILILTNEYGIPFMALIKIGLLFLDIAFVLRLLSLIVEMAKVVGDTQLIKRARLTKLAYVVALFFPPFVGVIAAFIQKPYIYSMIRDYQSFEWVVAHQHPSIMYFSVISILIVTYAIIFLIFDAFQMCRKFSKTINEATPPETQNA